MSQLVSPTYGRRLCIVYVLMLSSAAYVWQRVVEQASYLLSACAAAADSVVANLKIKIYSQSHSKCNKVHLRKC